jgi:hypothetical protein
MDGSTNSGKPGLSEVFEFIQVLRETENPKPIS